MNVVQLIRRARQGIDAILPGGSASSQWTNEETVDIANEAYEYLLREFRLVHKKWGLTTVNTSTTAYTRENETYTPSTALVISTTQQKISLPPDFAELVRVKCTSDTSIRIVPAQSETYHWIDLEQAGRDNSANILGTTPSGYVFYYDIIDNRTLFVTPPVTGSYNLEIDYIPMKRPLYYSNAGTVAITNAAAAVTGTNTTWVADSIYTETEGQLCEIIVGVTDIQSNQIRVDKDYPRVSAIASNTAATLKAVYVPVSVTVAPSIMAMCPTLPREYHRWMGRLMSALMLAKVSPDASEKYLGRFLAQFREQISPAIRSRQSQDSMVTEDMEEFGIGS